LRINLSNRSQEGLKLALLLVLALATMSGCSSRFLEAFALTDDIREDISLEEAQHVAPFRICLPTHLPDEVDPTPWITYHADWGDAAESNVQLRYYDTRDDIAIEIHQRYVPNASTPDSISEQTHRLYARDMLAWKIGWSEALQMMDEVTLNAAKYQDDDTIELWVFEIVEPTSAQMNMITWGNASVIYEVYTQVSTEEAKEIVHSILQMADCGTEMTSTP